MIIRLPRGISFILLSSAETNFLISFAKGRIVTQIFLRLILLIKNQFETYGRARHSSKQKPIRITASQRG